MRKITTVAAVTLAVVSLATSASAEVQLSLRDGRVTIVAKDATVRQILTEWARVGRTKIVNVERIPGTPLTIELRDVPEQEALKTLLRSISGYVTAPRAAIAASGASVYDRIIVMPTIAAAAAPITAAPPPPPFATFQPPQQPALGPDGDDDHVGEPRPAPASAMLPPGARGAVYTFPQPQVMTAQPPGPAGAVPAVPAQTPPSFFVPQPNAPALPPAAAYPGASTTRTPSGVSTPGMMVPAPPPPVQPVAPGAGQPPTQQP